MALAFCTGTPWQHLLFFGNEQETQCERYHSLSAENDITYLYEVGTDEENVYKAHK